MEEKMKTLALTMIVKNEAHNLPRLFKSCHGCFDHAYITDTGSTDGTIEYLQSEEAKKELGCDITLLHFEWINDFATARNNALPHIKQDYWMWMDADDTLSDKNEFMIWKKSVMQIYDVHFAPYWYAIDEKRNPRIQFVRERIFKTKLGCEFKEIVHEGVNFPPNALVTGIQNWWIVHERTEAELNGDRGRNLKILEENLDKISTRLKFYLGKEYFDNGHMEKASEILAETLKLQDLSIGDRILATQYLCQSLYNQNNFVDAIKYGLIGVNLDPTRAEYYCIIGDSLVSSGRVKEAIPMYRAALACDFKGNGLTHEFYFPECYEKHPIINLAKIYFNLGQLDECIEIIKDKPWPEAAEIKNVAIKAKTEGFIQEAQDCDDIVITCPMPPAYPWDEEIYKTKGLGGSETAAIEMAKWLKLLTNRQVKIFQERETIFVSDSGVEYVPLKHLMNYFRKWKPKIHIAWRHNIKLTNAPTYVWCHDLCFPQLAEIQNYEKVMALSEFHKNYLKSMLNIPDEKIMITRNGINPKRFENLDTTKQYGKVIWSNSPDRGLEHAIAIMDIVREQIPGAELHIFYGLENLRKYGQSEKADMLEKMISERPWIKYKGNVQQDILVKELASSEVWLYPACFIESSCISALESVYTKCWPIVKNIGALPNTLQFATDCKMAEVLDYDADEHEKWAKHVIQAIELKKYQDMVGNPNNHSWKSVAASWIEIFDL